MGFKRVEDSLNDPKSITPRHNTNLGSPLLKLEGLVVAKGLNTDFNSVMKRGLQLVINEFKRKEKAKYDALMKEYGGILGKKRG